MIRRYKFVVILVSIFCLSPAVAQNIVTTWAGTTTRDLIDGPRTDARFYGPFGMTIDRDGTIYIADAGNNCIRKITSAGDVSILAGSGIAGFHDGAPDSAQFNAPADVCVDDAGNVYVTDFSNQRIRKITAAGFVSTIAGSGAEGYVDGPAGQAMFDYPRGITRDRDGNLYIGDSWNHRIRKITSAGVVSTFAGGGARYGLQTVGDLKDAADTAARFYTPCGVFADTAGNIFVADAYNHRLRKITHVGVVSTIAGSGSTGQGSGGYNDGPVLSSKLNTPTEVFVAINGDVYCSDTFGNRVRRVSQGNVISLAGDGSAGFRNGPSATAQFNTPRGVVVSANGDSIFVCDHHNNSIRLITRTGSAVNELPLTVKIAVYPNPTHGMLTLDLPEEKTYSTVRIVNQDGKELFCTSRLNNFGLTRMDLASFPAGMYYCWAGVNLVARVAKW